ncbi:MAG: M48 family metallopeptidase [Betaproteobacteria bacterium]|nr:M48 family metallopeptidase [Betaproteobacteria bacterium]
MLKVLAVCALAWCCNVAHAQVPAASPVPSTTPSTASAQPVAGDPAVSAPIRLDPVVTARLDPVVATQAFMNRLQGEARAKSDAYAEGGYWLLLWNLVYGLVVAWLLLSRRISSRIRDFAERRTHRKSLQTLIYALAYIPLTALFTFPITFYEGFYREHQYGLSNLSFFHWLGESGISLGVDMVLLGIAITGLYAILRRVPQTWWAWGTIAGSVFIMLVMMIGPVFISPLFNSYKPLPDGPIRNDILSMARANGIPADNVYYFDASKQTKRVSANVSGLFGTTRISLNDNLLNRTSPAEIRAVMAHEMGHYVLNHGIKHTVSFSLVLLGGLLFIKFSWDWAAARFGGRFGVRSISDPAGLPLLAALFSVYVFLATPVLKTIIRTAEVEADLFGLNAAREPDGFAEAIFKLAEYRKLEPGAAEEFVFFDHPSGYSRIFASMRWKAENTK